MDITYRNKKIEKVCTDAKTAERTYGREMADKIHQRIDEIDAADTVEMMIQFHIERCHPLTQNRKGQYAVDLVHPYRLVFEKRGDEIQIANICGNSRLSLKVKMTGQGGSTMVRSRSFIATPPGATIKEQLNDRGMSQKEFAARMNMSEKHISKLINGDVQLTPETAVRLEMVLGVPAKFWNNLEAIYREKIIKAEAENAMDADVETAKQFPYSEMAKFGWVPEAREAKEKVVNLRKYFEVVELSLLESEQITRIACRRLAITDKSDLALMAWAQEAKIKARDIQTAPINIKGLISAMPEIRKMTVLKPKEFCPQIKKCLADCGTALVFLPHLKGSFLQGASFMDGNKIVVGLTARGKDADKFWFSLFHELAHIALGHVGQPNGTSEDDEKTADRWSGDMLITSEDFEAFRRNRDYSERSVLQFAKAQGIAPGIVVGRMQLEGMIKYSMLNNLKEKYEIAV